VVFVQRKVPQMGSSVMLCPPFRISHPVQNEIQMTWWCVICQNIWTSKG